MNILFSCYCCILGVFYSSDPGIYNLFYHWNKISLAALNAAVKQADSEDERKLYESTLTAMSDIWVIKPGSLNDKTLRWLFLEQISTDFDWRNKDWSVIEVRKNGERIRLINYLICYEGENARIIVYDYNNGKWIKLKDGSDHLKMGDLIHPSPKAPINKGGNFSDIAVTDFKSSSPLRSMYFVETTLKKGSIISSIIDR
ncbi:hypothetical protein F0L74_12855 [Chitinophaga agrisoli]|uniref:Uncharacterized protein n=1 Tax=Chitinophaga agrisoli TaxID=2607653 RepID=A0A5B2VW78_9BACT|nr:hypothetical protein [Chitinophaga agrisoli]KAA2243385.1 hypothetical protein F0L74_12855 [Chitinophaga agrisoli]